MQTVVFTFKRGEGCLEVVKILKKCKLKITFYDNEAASGTCLAKMNGEFEEGDELCLNIPFINGLTAEITHEGKEDINNLFRVFCI